MYIIERLMTLKSESPIVSGDYILADYFLKSLDCLHQKSVSAMVDETGISKTTIIQFCKKGGFSGVSSFLDELIYEYESFSLNDRRKNTEGTLPEAVSANLRTIRLLTECLSRANNIYLYGKAAELTGFRTIVDRRAMLKKNIFFLMGWSFKDIDEKLSLARENDVLIMIDTDTSCYSYFDRFSFRALYFQKDVTDRLPLKKFFIGRQGAEVRDFHQIILNPDQENSFTSLIEIWNYIADHQT